MSPQIIKLIDSIANTLETVKQDVLRLKEYETYTDKDVLLELSYLPNNLIANLRIDLLTRHALKIGKDNENVTNN